MFTDMAGTDLRNRLEHAWSARTANVGDRWSPKNPSLGQCAVTALLLQTYMGGNILRGEYDGGSHYWNRVALPSGAEMDVDLTRDQFGVDVETVELKNTEIRTREYLLTNADTKRRYEILVGNFERAEARRTPVAELLEVISDTEQIAIEPSMSDIQRQCWQTAEDHGWHEGMAGGAMFVEKLCLIHSELSEALEEYRDGHAYTEVYYTDTGKPEGIPIELADVFIRLADLAGIFDIDLYAAVVEKQEYNETRPYRHGGKKA